MILFEAKLANGKDKELKLVLCAAKTMSQAARKIADVHPLAAIISIAQREDVII